MVDSELSCLVSLFWSVRDVSVGGFSYLCGNSPFSLICIDTSSVEGKVDYLALNARFFLTQRKYTRSLN